MINTKIYYTIKSTADSVLWKNILKPPQKPFKLTKKLKKQQKRNNVYIRHFNLTSYAKLIYK